MILQRIVSMQCNICMQDDTPWFSILAGNGEYGVGVCLYWYCTPE